MRVSTALLHQRGVDHLQRQQQALLKTQTQLSTQQKMQSAAESPSDWAAAMGIDQLLAQSTRYQSNARTAQHRLALEEGALAEGIDLLAHARELSLQANSGTQSPESRALIAQELRGLRDQLLAIANRDDGQGRYLFAGASDNAAPFSWSGGQLSYNGDQQSQQLAIGNARSIALGQPGSEVFQRLKTGDGAVQVSTGSGNTGAIQVTQTRTYDAAALTGADWSLRFNGGNVEVLDAADNVVSTQAYTPGSSLRINGVELSLSGVPADGDRLHVSPSQQQDMIALLDKLANLIDSPQGDDVQRAQFQTGLQQALSELGRAETHLSAARTTAGLRLGVVEDAESTLAAQTVEAKSALSNLRDVDVAEAAGRLQMELLALQAAQASYAQVQRLSLFDYLR